PRSGRARSDNAGPQSGRTESDNVGPRFMRGFDPISGGNPVNRKHSDHQSRRHRLIGHDYENPGYYFITFATKNRRQLLGIINGDLMILSPTGRAVEGMIRGLPKNIGQIGIDSFAIMPDHVHLLLYIPIDKDSMSIPDVIRLIK